MTTTINDRIRILLHFKKLTATQLAEILDVQRSGISHVLSGRNKPSLDFVMKIVQAFPDVSYDWLISGKGDLSESEKRVKEEENTIVTPAGDTDVTSGESQKDTDVTRQSETTHEHAEKSQNTDNQTKKPEQESVRTIEKVVVFYSDNTFEEFTPSSLKG
ncbi:helix-turn-helix domain-containing protein [Salibacter halophilus]|uniref:Helix-turn-helix domain-containing protein n=1 Tax=Salibacter halophilus TaxID=1803916 RepID=A0A6N6M8Y7_9FLAO|nr:helix-turn-helix transcriptional regulator [Salibacter halophilus]KAB1065182.1 helix-turn-helix domain-containing protein [Salibacter halophilus]